MLLLLILIDGLNEKTDVTGENEKFLKRDFHLLKTGPGDRACVLIQHVINAAWLDSLPDFSKTRG